MRRECPRCHQDARDCRCPSRAPTPLERRLSAAGAAANAREDQMLRERQERARRKAEASMIIAARAEREKTPVFCAVQLALDFAAEGWDAAPKQKVERLEAALEALDGVQRARVLRLTLRALLGARGGEFWRAPLAAGAYAAALAMVSAGCVAPDGACFRAALRVALRTALRAPRWVCGGSPADVPRETEGGSE